MMRVVRAVFAAGVLLMSACTTSQNPIESQVGPKEPLDERLAGRWELMGDDEVIATIERGRDELAVTVESPKDHETVKYRVRITRLGRTHYASAAPEDKPESWTLFQMRIVDERTIVLTGVNDDFLFRAYRRGVLRAYQESGGTRALRLTASPRELRQFVRQNPEMFGGEPYELRRVDD